MKKSLFSFSTIVCFILVMLIPGCREENVSGPGQEKVGVDFSGRMVVPVNQVIEPYGQQLQLPGLRPQGLAFSPDGKLVAVSGKSSELLIIDPVGLRIRQKLPLPPESQNEPRPETASDNILEPDTKGQLSYNGLVFSPDGRHLYLSNVNGSLKVFSVYSDGQVRPSHTILLPPANTPGREEEIPSGLAFNRDGTRLYVCGNLSNQLLEIETATGRVWRAFPVGVAPFEVVLKGNKAYVSNWGGGRPGPDDLTGPAGRGTVVRVDPEKFIASEGSVTVIDLDAGRVLKEILVHLHSSALALSPDGRYLVCANAASDNLSVIDTERDEVVETIWVKRSPADLFGASPNALCFLPDGKKLLVANGTQNAVAVVDFQPKKKKSQLKGLIPAGWFPGVLAWDARKQRLWVANIKGLADRPRTDDSTGMTGFNTHQYYGSLSVFSWPGKKELVRLTARVLANYHRERIDQALKKPRANIKPRPVPERIGEPSLIKHVVYIIKENRTYDQILGDVPEGNGNPSLCLFGEEVTPNQHRLVREFVLLDNIYCSGILSADGHQWSTTAFGTDYLEKSFAGWPRSYPDGMGPDDVDALAYSPSGFIWDNCLKHGVSLWNFGEFAMPDCGWADPKRTGEPGWLDFWHEYLYGKGEVRIGSRPAIPSIASFTSTDYVGWNMNVPDVWRARFIKNKIKDWEEKGEMPQLVLICLPIDHTSGTKAGMPTPRAAVADNDLALGQIVEAFSHSSFWKEMVILAIEDDPQNGFDHVSGYRTTAYLAGPYVKRGAVVSTHYNTTSLLRTIEQILGLPPMNQFDASASPMFDCFTEEPDFRPYAAIPNRVPLDELNPEPKKIADKILKKNAVISARLNFRQVDACPETVLNRIIWQAVRGSKAPYPDWAVTVVQDDD
ncbi:MAG: phosphoesterase [Candidatus Saccharicenans sp.]|jgi:YVTN family beta-propeller protein|nr:phosphoesterase [Candidatus Saccharicenans sp.]MDH7492966.1 alkaline phosphatase family protein [Candidatus Saccharicenans sp.]